LLSWTDLRLWLIRQEMYYWANDSTIVCSLKLPPTRQKRLYQVLQGGPTIFNQSINSRLISIELIDRGGVNGQEVNACRKTWAGTAQRYLNNSVMSRDKSWTCPRAFSDVKVLRLVAPRIEVILRGFESEFERFGVGCQDEVEVTPSRACACRS